MAENKTGQQGLRARLRRAKAGFRDGLKVYKRMVGYLARHKLGICAVIVSSGRTAEANSANLRS